MKLIRSETGLQPSCCPFPPSLPRRRAKPRPLSAKPRSVRRNCIAGPASRLNFCEARHFTRLHFDFSHLHPSSPHPRDPLIKRSWRSHLLSDCLHLRQSPRSMRKMFRANASARHTMGRVLGHPREVGEMRRMTIATEKLAVAQRRSLLPTTCPRMTLD